MRSPRPASESTAASAALNDASSGISSEARPRDAMSRAMRRRIAAEAVSSVFCFVRGDVDGAELERLERVLDRVDDFAERGDVLQLGHAAQRAHALRRMRARGVVVGRADEMIERARELGGFAGEEGDGAGGLALRRRARTR